MKPAAGRRGQYLVEFAMAIVIFVFVLVACVELALATYNYRLMNAAAMNAARLGVRGGSDAEMRQLILDAVDDLYPTAFLRCDFGPGGVAITPDPGDRLRGELLTVAIDLRQAATLMGYAAVTIDWPVAVSLPMTCDVYVDTDQDGSGDYTDADDDNDGWTDAVELASGTDPRDAAAHP